MYRPSSKKTCLKQHGNNYIFDNNLYAITKLGSLASVKALLTGNPKSVCDAIKADPAFQLAMDMQKTCSSNVKSETEQTAEELKKIKHILSF